MERLKLLSDPAYGIPGAGDSDAILGRSEALLNILDQVELVASTRVSVLIFGESGTGKELIARRIHARSQRRNSALVKVNCASIPQELFESEFFGHARGAFTGALKERVGRFQAAHEGTLFLDEAGEIPPPQQSKLLRVLQEGEFERVGEDHTRRVDVRIVAATNRDLPAEVAAGRFRQDLYYRLSAFPIVVPSLRDRMDDIPELAAAFLRNACKRHGMPLPELKGEHIARLKNWHWPGNIRELQHVIERALILGRGRVLELVFDARGMGSRAATEELDSNILTAREMQNLEAHNYRKALRRSNGRLYGTRGAAALLGLPPTTLASRLKALGIAEPNVAGA